MAGSAPLPNDAAPAQQSRGGFLGWHGQHAALASGILAVALSVAGSWRPSIWYDEAATLSAIHRPWGSLWKLIHHVDVVHFSYYSLLRCWAALFGSSAFSIRALSALLLGAACAMGVSVCRDILGKGPSLWVAVIFPLLPGLTWCGLDARPTALSCCTTMAATWMVLRADRLDRRRWWLLYAITIVLTVAAQLLTILVVPVHFALVKNRRHWAFSVAVPVLMAAVFADIGHSQSVQLAWLNVTIPQALPSLLISQNVLGLRSDSGLLTTALAPGLLALVTWVLVVKGMRRDRPHLILLGWAVLPGAVTIVWSLITTPIYQERYFTWCVPPFAMLVAAGLHKVSGKSTKVAAVFFCTLLLGAIPIDVAQRHTNAKYLQDYRSLANKVAELPRDHTGVIYAEPGSRAASATYPSAFRGLTDLSRLEGPTPTGTFWGVDRPARTAIKSVKEQKLTHVLFLYEWTKPLAKRPEVREFQQIGCDLKWVSTLRRTNAAWFECH